jgi:hypothetical protein
MQLYHIKFGTFVKNVNEDPLLMPHSPYSTRVFRYAQHEKKQSDLHLEQSPDNRFRNQFRPLYGLLKKV